MRGAGKTKTRTIGYCLILSMTLVLWILDYGSAAVKYRLGTGDAIDFAAVSKINHGAGSGLDADMVDGKHASDFMASGTGGIKDTDIDWGLSSGQINTDDIPEGAANKYFSGKTTDNLPEGTTNKYNPFGASVDSAEITDGAITNADVSGAAAIVESKLGLNYATHSNAYDPTSDEKAALAGTSGTPSAANRYVTNSDSRLSDARTPLAHASSHASGGADALTGDLDSNARIAVRKNTGGADVGERRRLNLIEGSNVTLTVTDDPVDEEIDVTIASSGGGSSTFAGLTDTPSSYTGQAGKYAKVNATEDGLEFAAVGSGANPSFSVHKNGTDQTGVATVTWTKLTWPTEEFDTNNDFATDKFTPTVAGKYMLTASVWFTTMADGKAGWVAIYKNGTAYKKGSYSLTGGGTSGYQSVVTCVADANGSTDYFEAYCFQNSGSDKTASGSTDTTYFQGCKVD